MHANSAEPFAQSSKHPLTKPLQPLKPVLLVEAQSRRVTSDMEALSCDLLLVALNVLASICFELFSLETTCPSNESFVLPTQVAQGKLSIGLLEFQVDKC